MVPSAFVLLDALPITPNGKLDRRALPAPKSARPEPDAAYVAPRTTIERTIAEVWREVLQVERLGIHDNFFDLGGHSLLMIQVQHRLQAALDQPIALVDLFRYPNIDTLADFLAWADKWIVDNRERVIKTIVDETGKTYEDALIAEFNYAAAAFGFWAKNAPKYLADEKARTASP